MESLFEQLAELSEEERVQRLDVECRDDLELREALEKMFRAMDIEDQFLVSPVKAAPKIVLPQQLGEFELLEEVGRGGMGVVYRARQARLGRTVALKVLSHSVLQTTRQLERFRREARAAARLTHPGIVTIHAEGTVDDVHFFTMEYVAGPSLDDLLRARRHLEKRQWPVESAALEHPAGIAGLIAGVADALQAAHDAGVVHRDVKPSNLLMAPGGMLKLSDFGLVLDQQEASMSYAGEVFGTPHYISPEQAEGRTEEVDRRTDVYSLGVVLYELLTGSRPIEGESAIEVLRGVVEREPRAVRSVNRNAPLDLAIICEVAMARRPSDRYQSAADMAADLRRALHLEPILARPLPLARKMARWVRRNRSSITAASITAMAVIALAMTFREAARRLEIAGLVASVDDYLTMDDREVEELPALRNLSAAVVGLGELTSALSSSDREALEKALRHLDAATERRASRGEEEVLEAVQEPRGLEPWRTPTARIVRGTTVVLEMNEIRRQVGLAELVIEDHADKRWEIDAPGGVVWLQEFDSLTGIPGPAIQMGPSPARFSTPPGHYLVSVRVEDRIVAEFDRIAWVTSDAFRLSPPSVEDERANTDEMVLIEPVPVTYSAEDGTVAHLAGIEFHLAPYWIDKYEVTNGEYAEFVKATGHRPPLLWRDSANWDPTLPKTPANYREDWDELPVVCVMPSDAQAYAEWRGKRLLTYAEWLYAARGPRGRIYPWTDDRTVADYLGNCNQRMVPTPEVTPLLTMYLGAVAPARSHPEAATEDGVYHLLGNVDEINGSLFITDSMEGHFECNPKERFKSGGSWLAGSFKYTLPASHSPIQDGPEFVTHRIGFRCARSQ
ncbi:Serine/threonine-protein kinase PrkC [Planctomycetes bacterium Poly30]|uniref:Serine/threonine-protein kinase PrkC n=1 Tax=Saltatorellus ferox TaxID=2528018 RepID=A0A518EUF5_9BACT|nr:Serine/threonine-protein kinase PrkC [Planctomycetes bacterium Poly30]